MILLVNTIYKTTYLLVVFVVGFNLRHTIQLLFMQLYTCNIYKNCIYKKRPNQKYENIYFSLNNYNY